jgi:hypothetical protein
VTFDEDKLYNPNEALPALVNDILIFKESTEVIELQESMPNQEVKEVEDKEIFKGLVQDEEQEEVQGQVTATLEASYTEKALQDTYTHYLMPEETASPSNIADVETEDNESSNSKHAEETNIEVLDGTIQMRPSKEIRLDPDESLIIDGKRVKKLSARALGFAI